MASRTWDALSHLCEGVMQGAAVPLPTLPFEDMVKLSLYRE